VYKQQEFFQAVEELYALAACPAAQMIRNDEEAASLPPATGSGVGRPRGGLPRYPATAGGAPSVRDVTAAM